MLDYAEFLSQKRLLAPLAGRPCDPSEVNPILFPWQRQLVAWAVRKGRSALWASTGLGKSFMQIEFARLTGERTLILTPLAVAQQTVKEGAKLGVPITYARGQATAAPTGLTITNYEMVEHFDAKAFGAVVIDESSCLKHFESVRRTQLIETFSQTPYRLAATATPAPNHIEELANHAEFLGILTRQEFLSAFFVHDDNGWRLKGHAKAPFYRWLASWAMSLNKPSDIGPYSNEGYDLPPLTIEPVFVATDYVPEGRLFPDRLQGVSETAAVRRDTIDERVQATVERIMDEPEEPWIAWCGLNDEGRLLHTWLKNESVLIEGPQSAEVKTAKIEQFLAGEKRVMIVKPSIAGFGLNLQCCARMIFVGLGYCFDEQTEILTGRGWRSFADVTTADEVATVNPETLAFEWQQPSEVIWEPYEGPMLHFQGQRNFDLLVTPNHKLFVKRCDKRFPSDKSGWQLKPAAEIADRYRRSEWRMLSTPVGFDGALPEKIDIPALDWQRRSSRVVRSIKTADFMRLAGWYLSEGYCPPMTSGSRGRITISQGFGHPENRAEIINLLRSLGLNVGSQTKDIYACSLNLAAFLMEQFGTNSRNKRIPAWVKNLDDSLLRLLRDTMIKGDGCHYGEATTAYRSFSHQLRDDFQEICLKTGVRAAVKSEWGGLTLAWSRLNPSIHQEPERVDYRGMIGCVTVPHHVVIVRRNGIPVVSGQSYEQYFQCLRRCWRFGQTREVKAFIVLSEPEEVIYRTVLAKEKEAEKLSAELIRNAAEYEREELQPVMARSDYRAERELVLPGWLG